MLIISCIVESASTLKNSHATQPFPYGRESRTVPGKGTYSAGRRAVGGVATLDRSRNKPEFAGRINRTARDCYGMNFELTDNAGLIVGYHVGPYKKERLGEVLTVFDDNLRRFVHVDATLAMLSKNDFYQPL